MASSTSRMRSRFSAISSVRRVRCRIRSPSAASIRATTRSSARSSLPVR